MGGYNDDDPSHSLGAGTHGSAFTFDDGARREIDIAALTDFKGVFEPLKSPRYFRRVRVEPEVGTIVWPNGADFCPDVLYEESTPAPTQESA